jgi:starch synthase
VVDDGKTGLLGPPGDEDALAAALTELVADRDRATRMGIAGRDRAIRQFSWRTIAEQTAKLYRELIG